MSGDATADWLKALRAALVADTALVNAVGRDPANNVKVYSRAPAAIAFPLILIGDATSIDWSTSDTDGQEFRQDIECWDGLQDTGNESPDATRTRRMMDRIRAILHRPDLLYVPFAVPGRNLALVQVIGTALRLEADTATNRGTVTVRVLIGN